MLKKITYSIFFLLVIFSAKAQVNTFNKWFLPNGTYPSGGLEIVENDTGYVIIGFAPLGKNVVSFIDSLGNFQYSKVYEHTDFFYYPETANNLNLLNNGNESLYGIEKQRYDSIHTYYSALIIKFDSNFDTIFIKSYFEDTLYSDCAQSVEDDFGNYVFAGYNSINSTSWDAVLFSVDTIGNLLWEKRYGGGGAEQTYLLLNAFNGGYLIGGKSSSFGINSPYDNGEWYIVKTDSIGNFKWHRHYGNSSFDDGRIRSMCKTNDSCYFLAGAYTVEKYGAYTNIRKSRLVKINQFGDIIWDKIYGYKGRENIIFKVFQLDNGDIITVSNNDSISQYCSSINPIVHCLDYEGNVKWRRKYNFINDTCSFWSAFSNFINTKDKGYLFTGMGYNVNLTPRQYTWVVKTDSLGFDGISDFLSDTTYRIQQIGDTCYNDTIIVKTHLYGITAPYTINYQGFETHDNLYYSDLYYPFVSDSLIITSSMISGLDSIENIICTITDGLGRILTDTIYVNVACIVSNERINSSEIRIKICPNPAKSIINIKIKSMKEKLLLEIFNDKGQCVKEAYINNNFEQIDINNYVSGIYLIKLSNSKFSYSEKIVINMK